MGQQNNKEGLCDTFAKKTAKSPEQLIYYTTVNDRQFGEISVYCSLKKPSSYVAKIERIVDNSKIYNIFQHIQNVQLSTLASLYAFQIQRSRYLTGHIEQKITAYWQYYNYLFVDYLKMRSVKKMPFSESQIWVLVKSLCESFYLFSSHNLILDLDLKHIVVIPEGKIKMYWHHIELNKQHIKFYQKVREQYGDDNNFERPYENRKFKHDFQLNNDFFYFSPQEIEGINKRQATLQIDFSKANSFRLGMIILYCITLTNPIKTCYGQNSENKRNRIKIMVLNSLYENKVQNSTKYSEDLKHLIKLLLLEDPNKRIPITCLQNVYEKYMSEDTELAMGINQNLMYAHSSQRKYLREDEHKAQQSDKRINKKFVSKHIHHRNPSEKDSLKIIEESRIKTGSNRNQMPGYQNHNQNQSNPSKRSQKFDQFDTKTIKISQTYQKR